MTNNLQKLLQELKELDLPIGEYVIVSSAVMAARDIRECGDLDLLITEKLFNELSKKYTVDKAENFLKVLISENIEGLYFGHNPEDIFPAERQIKEAEIINGFPFQNLGTCLYFKENGDREKDKADVILIKEFLAKE